MLWHGEQTPLLTLCAADGKKGWQAGWQALASNCNSLDKQALGWNCESQIRVVGMHDLSYCPEDAYPRPGPWEEDHACVSTTTLQYCKGFAKSYWLCRAISA